VICDILLCLYANEHTKRKKTSSRQVLKGRFLFILTFFKGFCYISITILPHQHFTHMLSPQGYRQFLTLYHIKYSEFANLVLEYSKL
jgi:hypothetical protein